MDTEARVDALKNTVVVDLGTLRQSVEDRVKAGSYASADEVTRAALLRSAKKPAQTTGCASWLRIH